LKSGLRAERRAGELLKQMKKAEAGRKPRNWSSASTDSKTLAGLGVSNYQSSKWQKLADVPQDDFEKALAQDFPSTTGIVKAAESPKVRPMDPTALWLWGHRRPTAGGPGKARGQRGGIDA
jgi:hypothetical protein